MSFLAPVVLFDILADKKRVLTANKPKTTVAIGWLILTAILLGPVGTFVDSWHSVASWLESTRCFSSGSCLCLQAVLLPGLIWIGFNKTLLNKLMTTRGIPELLAFRKFYAAYTDKGNKKRNKVMTLCAQR